MESYHQIIFGDQVNNSVIMRNSDSVSIPFDTANTDYAKFKLDIADGAELQDPDGNAMTQEQVDAFLKTIP